MRHGQANAASVAAFLFRSQEGGEQATEPNMAPDEELIETMCRHKIRVQDLIATIYAPPGVVEERVARFLEEWRTR